MFAIELLDAKAFIRPRAGVHVGHGNRTSLLHQPVYAWHFEDVLDWDWMRV